MNCHFIKLKRERFDKPKKILTSMRLDNDIYKQ